MILSEFARVMCNAKAFGAVGQISGINTTRSYKLRCYWNLCVLVGSQYFGTLYYSPCERLDCLSIDCPAWINNSLKTSRLTAFCTIKEKLTNHRNKINVYSVITIQLSVEYQMIGHYVIISSSDHVRGKNECVHLYVCPYNIGLRSSICVLIWNQYLRKHIETSNNWKPIVL